MRSSLKPYCAPCCWERHCCLIQNLRSEDEVPSAWKGVKEGVLCPLRLKAGGRKRGQLEVEIYSVERMRWRVGESVEMLWLVVF